METQRIRSLAFVLAFNLALAAVLGLTLGLGWAGRAAAQTAGGTADPGGDAEPLPPAEDCSLTPGVRTGVECIDDFRERGTIKFRKVNGAICEYLVAPGWADACDDLCPGLMDVIYNPSNQTVACVSYGGPGEH